MTTQLRVACAQVDTRVGDLAGNAELVTTWTAKAAEAGAHVVVFPEMTLTGYPAEDLVLRESFSHASEQTLIDLNSTGHKVMYTELDINMLPPAGRNADPALANPYAAGLPDDKLPEVRVSEGTPTTINDAGLARRLNASLARTFGEGVMRPF